MRQIVILFFLGSVLFSCKKEKVPEPCTNVTLTGQRASVVGTWRWYKTWINQIDASGSTFTYDVTPTTEGFNYYCIISADGKYKGYKDSILVDEHNLTSIFVDKDNGFGDYSLASLLDCGEEQLVMTLYSTDSTEDILKLREFPIYFDDPVQKKKSSYNFFKRD